MGQFDYVAACADVSITDDVIKVEPDWGAWYNPALDQVCSVTKGAARIGGGKRKFGGYSSFGGSRSFGGSETKCGHK